MTNKEIFDLLGIETEFRELWTMRGLPKQFKELNEKYPAETIWLKGDYGIYVQGKVADETEDLIVVL